MQLFLGMFERFQKLTQDSRTLDFVSLFVIALALLLALPAISIPLGLPPEGDAVDYRVPIISWILRHGEYPNWPWTMVDDYPMLGELMMLPLRWLRPGLDRLIPIAAYMSLGWAGGKIVSSLGPKNFPRNSLFLCGFAWALALRPITLQSNLLMVDNLASAFLLCSLVFLIENRVTQSAIFAAFALATRYTVWGSVAFFPFILFFQTRDVRRCIFFGLFAGLGALPFMVRNFFVNDGNPFFPIGNKVALAAVGVNSYGRGKDLLSFILLPYDILVTNSFVSGIFDYTVGKLFYLQLFAALVVGLYGAWRLYFRRTEFIVFIFAFVHLVIWFFSGQQMRFLVPTILVFNMAILALIANRGRVAVLILITALGAFSIVSVQKDSLLMFLGKRESIFLTNVNEAMDCFSSAGVGGDVVGLVRRDGILGFLKQDFRFLAPHPYAISGSSERDLLWVYGSSQREGYTPWPKERPCLLRRSIDT